MQLLTVDLEEVQLAMCPVEVPLLRQPISEYSHTRPGLVQNPIIVQQLGNGSV